MEIIGVRALRHNLAEYLEQTEQGKAFVIVQRSKPVARLIPYEEEAMSEEQAAYITPSDLNEQLEQMQREGLAGELAFNAYGQTGLDKQAAIRALAEAILKVQALP